MKSIKILGIINIRHGLRLYLLFRYFGTAKNSSFRYIGAKNVGFI